MANLSKDGLTVIVPDDAAADYVKQGWMDASEPVSARKRARKSGAKKPAARAVADTPTPPAEA